MNISQMIKKYEGTEVEKMAKDCLAQFKNEGMAQKFFATACKLKLNEMKSGRYTTYPQERVKLMEDAVADLS